MSFVARHLLPLAAISLFTFACTPIETHEGDTTEDAGASHKEESLIVTAAQTIRVPLSADTAVRSYFANTPGGTSRDLLVGRSWLDWTRSMVRVDTPVIKSALGTEGRLLSAKLHFTVTVAVDAALNNTQVGAHRMTRSWTEAGATWNCSVDTNPTNLWKDCNSANSWVMGGGVGTGPYVTTPSGTSQVATGLTGTLELDVTSDVKAFLAGTAVNNGWLLRVQNDPLAAAMILSSREGTSPPALALTFVGKCNAATGTCGKEVRWESPTGDELPILEDPIPSKATAAAADAFTWQATNPVPELTPEGYPTLRYATIYIESLGQLAALDAYQIDHERLPFFAEEQVKWQGKKGIFEFKGDGRGIFVFAIIPGKMYNLLRKYALDHPNEQPYRAIILRAPPTSIPTSPGGSLRSNPLADQGYQYRGIGSESVNSGGVSGTSQALSLGGIAGAVVGWIANTGEDIIDGVRQGLGEAGKFLKGAAALNLTFYSNVADPGFKSKDLVRRGWGPDIGRPIPLRGAEVRIAQGVFRGQLQKDITDSNGFVRMIVTHDSKARVCVRLANNDVYLTSWGIFPMETCQFDKPASEVKGEVTERVNLNSRYAQGFVQASDSADYLSVVGKHNPHQARVLTGDLADWLTGVQSNGGGAFAPCSGFLNWKFDSLLTVMNAVAHAAATSPPLQNPQDNEAVLWEERLAAIGGIGAQFVSPDIVISRDALRSRGVLTHEYGHFAMCSLLYHESARVFADAYTEVIEQALLGGGNARDEARVVAEAWADFFSAQVVGGVNYFRVFGTPPDPAKPAVVPSEPTFSRSMWYCHPNERQCMDNNVGNSSTYDRTNNPFAERMVRDGLDDFKGRIARITTTIHDVFDGNPQAGAANVPSNGAAWFNDKPIDGERTETTSSYVFANNSHQADESVAVPMDLRKLFHSWTAQGDNFKHKLTEASLNVALTDYMKSYGISETHICQLFALHSSSNVCPSNLPINRNVTPGPVKLSGHLYAGSDPLVEDLKGLKAHWEWTADAPFADRFEYTLMDGSTQLERDWPVYERGNIISVNREGLSFNREYELTVTVINGTRRSTPVSLSLATPAEPVITVSAAQHPGYSRVCWSETQATSYELEYRVQGGDWASAAVLDDTTAVTSCYSLRALKPISTEARVIARNRHGVPATASPIVTFTPLPPKDIFVSLTRGNDATATGTQALPFASIPAAVTFLANQRAVITQVPICNPVCTTQPVRSTVYDYAALRIAAGNYIAPAISFNGAAFTTILSGGLAEGTWLPISGSRSSVSISLSPGPVRGCGGSGGDVPWLSGLSVQDGSLFVEGFALSATAVGGDGGSSCQTILGARRASGLTITDSSLAVLGQASGLACQAALIVDGSAGSPADGVSIVDSRLTAMSSTTARNIYGFMLGMCAGDMPSVRVERSRIMATDAPQQDSFTATGSLSGAWVSNAQTLSVSRSFMTVTEATPGWRNGTSQLGLGATAKYISLDNSVFRTATGGAGNAAIALTSLAGGDVTLAQVTAITGADWAQTGVGPSGNQSAFVMSLAGTTKRMTIVNSLFAYAAGAHIDKTGIDRSGLTVNPTSALIAGNIFSVYDLTFEGSIANASPVRCKQELGGYADMWNLNTPAAHHCRTTTGSQAAYKVHDNQWLYFTPCSGLPAADQAVCQAGKTGRGSAYPTNATEHFWDGEPSPTLDGRLACGGIKLPSEFAQNGKSFADKAINGITRLQNRPGVDDNCDIRGLVDEPGESSGLNSVGAYDAPCFCPARQMVIF